MACPVCRAGSPQPRWFKWHQRTDRPTVPWRCDVSFKCVACSACWIHGVAVPGDYYRANAGKPGRKIPWRDARRMLEG